MEETETGDDDTLGLSDGIEQLQAGNPFARGELLNLASRRLTQLAQQLRGHCVGLDPNLSTDQILQPALLRLHQALHDTPSETVRDFYRLAATVIRAELIALCRSAVDSDRDLDPPQRRALRELQRWSEFHDQVAALPATDREVFDLIWVHQCSRQQVMQLLNLSEAEVRRRWRAARLGLYSFFTSAADDETN